jgi:hypothetical protein
MDANSLLSAVALHVYSGEDETVKYFFRATSYDDIDVFRFRNSSEFD